MPVVSVSRTTLRMVFDSLATELKVGLGLTRERFRRTGSSGVYELRMCGLNAAPARSDGLPLGLHHATVGQQIGMFVARMPGVPAHPFPGHLVAIDLFVQQAPQVGILYRLLR